MSRYIDADALVKDLKKRWNISSDPDFANKEVWRALEDAPSIDIVRCRECKHWCKGDEVYGICYRCPNTRQMRHDDFCSYGEVRDE